MADAPAERGLGLAGARWQHRAVTTQPADPASRRRALRWLVASTAVGAAALVLLHLGLSRALEAPADEALATLLFALRVMTGAMAIGAIAFAGWLWWVAGRVSAARRFPPPGLVVGRDTRIVEGDAAQRLAIALRLIGVALVAATVAAMAIAVRLGAG